MIVINGLSRNVVTHNDNISLYHLIMPPLNEMAVTEELFTLAKSASCRVVLSDH